MKSQVGIFWILPGTSKLILFSRSVSEVDVEVGFKTGPYDHYETWTEVQKEYPLMREAEYDRIPRGRVVYNVEEKNYFVYSNKEVLSNYKAEIIEAFDLPIKKIKFLEDDHYFIQNDQNF